MTEDGPAGLQISRAVHGRREVSPDPRFEVELALSLRETMSSERLLDLYSRFAANDGAFDTMMRRVLWRAIARHVGDRLHVASNVGFTHLETFEIGSGVFLGAQTHVQGWFRGVCRIGNHVWIGPQSYFDARNLVIEDYVGWGPGAKVLCSMHAALPLDVPIVQTDLHIKPVRICEWADVGTNAIVLPGVTVGRGAIVGAGAVVTQDVPPFTVVAGVPARVIRERRNGSAEPLGAGVEAGIAPWSR